MIKIRPLNPKCDTKSTKPIAQLGNKRRLKPELISFEQALLWSLNLLCEVPSTESQSHDRKMWEMDL